MKKKNINMMKKRNKGNSTLTAVGAVVAAGLTPGVIAAATTGSPLHNPNAELTAAEVVAIGDNTYGFDELYAMQQPSSREDPQIAVRYGVRPPNQQTTLYGVPRPRPVPPPSPQEIKAQNIEIALDTIQLSLMEYCAQLIDADAYGILISPDSDLTRNLGMTSDELKELQAEIKRRYDVEVSYNRFYLVGQLNTLRLISEHIVKLKHLWD